MNRTIKFDELGGLYVYQDTLKFLQTAYSQLFDALGASIGNKIVLLGCSGFDDPDQAVSAPGWIIIDGEILPFLGGNKLPKIRVETITDIEQFDDTTQKGVYITKRAVYSNLTGNDSTEFKRLPFNAETLFGNLQNVQNVLKGIVNYEPSVIISGCSVSNIDTVASTCKISAGVILFNGNYVASPEYTGQYPAFLKDNGKWVTALPGAGEFIKFDPHTSQRYQDVLRRFNHISGEFKICKVLSDRFDVGTGLGKWEWLGWKISDDMGGRTFLGYDRRNADPYIGTPDEGNIWDAIYATVGITGGAKTHKLTINEMPKHRFKLPLRRSDNAFGLGASTAPTTNGDGSTAGGGAYNANSYQTEELGSDIPHNNLQPYKVVVILERI